MHQNGLGPHSWKVAWEKRTWQSLWTPSYPSASNVPLLPRRLMGCIREGVASRVILPLNSALVSPHLQCVSSSGLSSIRAMELLETVQQRATKIMEGPDHLTGAVR